MSPNPYSLDDADPYGYARRRMKALSPTVPPAAMNPSGSSQGFSTDDPGDDSSWWKPQLDPAANRISSLPSLSASGPSGNGQTAQPAAKAESGDLSVGAGKVLGGSPKMPPPGMPAATDDPGAAGLPPVQSQQQLPPGVTPRMQALQDRSQQLVDNAPKMIGDRPQDIDPATGKEKLGAKVASWGQRLAMALLSAGKLAPYAQQIVHPEYSQQMEANAAEQKGIQGELANAEKIQTIGTAASAQQANEGLKNEQAALAKEKSDPHYGMREIDADYAKENLPWMQPEIGPDGKPHYFIDKAVESTLSKPVPEAKLIGIPEGGSLYDPSKGQIVATGTPKVAALKESETPLGARVPQINQMLAARYQVLHPGKPLPSQFMMPPNAVQQDFANVDKVLEAEERATGTQAQLGVVNEMHRQTMELAAGNRQQKTDTATKQAAMKSYQPVLDSAERLNVMTQNYEDAIKNHDQQAMLSLLANHLGMTMGLQKGARLNQAIINEAAKSQPWISQMAAKFDKQGYLSGLTLSPQQMRSMVSLGRDRYSQDLSKARNEAQYMGVQDDGPTRTPSKSTINFYVAQAGGNAAKAKELAAADGWSIH